MDKRKLKWKTILRFSLGTMVYACIFFFTAGTLRYWEAWVFMATLFVPMIFTVRDLLRTDPEFLERRLTSCEPRFQQKLIQLLGAAFWLPALFIPGLDHRFGWTSVPVVVVALGDVLLLSGYYLAIRSMRENRFAARTIRVEEGQEVITTGPYRLVRHPMYLGASIMALAAPLALGSYLAVVPTLLLPIFMILRILDEEKLLLEELPDYAEYTQKTRYRLIPRVW